METDRIEREKPKRGWVIYALIGSLGVNLLVVGLVAGVLLRDVVPMRGRPDRAISALGLRAYFRALDRTDRTALRAVLRADRGQFHAGSRTFRAHLRALSKALMAEPYDAKAVAAVLQVQAKNLSEDVAFGQKLLLERIAAMSPKARKLFAARLLERRGNRRGGRKASKPFRQRN